MTAAERWRSYARCWSSETARSAQLGRCVDEVVTYIDPGVALEDREALAGYMGTFEQAFPGGEFAIDVVYAHHSRSLAQWRQLAPDGGVVRHGASFAMHGADGRFTQVTGFFLDQSETEELP